MFNTLENHPPYPLDTVLIIIQQIAAEYRHLYTVTEITATNTPVSRNAQLMCENAMITAVNVQ